MLRPKLLSLSPAALGFLLACQALCQTYTLSAPSTGDRVGEIQVNISETPAAGGASVFPPVALVQDQSLWHVTIYRKLDDHLQVVTPEVAVNQVLPSGDYARTGNVTLKTSTTYRIDPYTDRRLVAEIQFLGGPAIASVLWPAEKPAPAATGTKGGGSSKGGSSSGCAAGAAPQQPGTSYANYCLSGIWIPQVGSHPLYSTSSNFALAHKLGPGSLGLRAQESADSSVVLDPNAFSSAVFYQAVIFNRTSIPHVMGLYFNWNLATVEFDRKKKNTNLGTNVNLITAPEAVIPVSFGHVAGAEIDAGVEFGHNFKNNIDPNGFGRVFRGFLGAQAAKIFVPRQHLKALYQIKVGSQYQVRLPEDDEVITRSVHGRLVPHKGHQARHWVSTAVDFMFTPHFGLTLKYDYGALPPGFVFIENRATVGFTVQSAQ